MIPRVDRAAEPDTGPSRLLRGNARQRLDPGASLLLSRHRELWLVRPVSHQATEWLRRRAGRDAAWSMGELVVAEARIRPLVRAAIKSGLAVR
jgi:hypothetical protein